MVSLAFFNIGSRVEIYIYIIYIYICLLVGYISLRPQLVSLNPNFYHKRRLIHEHAFL